MNFYQSSFVKRTRSVWGMLLLAALAALLFSACGGGTATATPTATPEPPTATATSQPTPSPTAAVAAGAVKMVENNGVYSFTPASLTVKVGTTVVWTNTSDAPHTVTSDTGAFVTPSSLSQGQTYSFTFTTAGTFPYHCAIHPYMKATIVVTP